MGEIIEFWQGRPLRPGGGYPAAFGVMLALQAAALLWFGAAGRRSRGAAG
jgi:hypothetical protein